MIVLLLCGLAPGLWVRVQHPPPNRDQRVTLVALPLAAGCCRIGPFTLDNVWHLTGANSNFGSYSGLARMDPGRLMAFTDRGYFLDIADPHPGPGDRVVSAIIGPTIADARQLKDHSDVEEASFDPASRRLWLALEGRNGIARHGADLVRQGFRQTPVMRRWPQNSGPEAMVRLNDGRFIVLAEAFDGRFENRLHQALLFSGDPVEGAVPFGFSFAGPQGYRPTGMAQLPDGRVLVLMRRLLWPLPLRTAGRIVLLDPAEITPGGLWRGRQIASLDAPLPVDNFEAIMIEPAAGGMVTVWLLSDDNGAVSQRTLLWRMTLDPAQLPGSADKQKAHDHLARPAQ